MPANDELSKDDMISRVFYRTVGGLGAWEQPREPPILGDDFIYNLANRQEQRDTILTQIREHLLAKSLAEIFEDFDENGRAVNDNSKRWQRENAEKADDFTRGLSIWMQAGLGAPKLLADFDHWSKMTFLEFDDVLWLSVGLEPLPVFEAQIARNRSRETTANPIAEYVVRHKELFRRELMPNGHEGRFQAERIQSWTRRVEVLVHPGFDRMLTKMAQAIGPAETNPTATGDRAAANTSGSKFEQREKVSMAKMLVTMAMDCYGYDPPAARSPVPAEIQDMAAKLGIVIDTDTIRKYLQLGASYISTDR